MFAQMHIFPFGTFLRLISAPCAFPHCEFSEIG